ncbi:hypothetical protein V6N13_028403 [Hibiscus sabdariffa]
MLLLCQWLHQGINNVVIRVYLSYSYISSYEMEALKNVFGSSMRSGFFACAMAPFSLQQSSTTSDMLEITLSSDMNFLIQTASSFASPAAMYSAFVVELATVFCIEIFKFIVLSFRQTQNLIAIVSHPCQFEGWLQCNLLH